MFWFASVLKRVKLATLGVASFSDGFGETIGGENSYTRISLGAFLKVEARVSDERTLLSDTPKEFRRLLFCVYPA